MVKALDLRSNGHMSAWVRTPLLVVAFFSPPFNILFFKNQFHRAYHNVDSRTCRLAGRGANRTTRSSASHKPEAADSASGLGVARRRRPGFRQRRPRPPLRRGERSRGRGGAGTPAAAGAACRAGAAGGEDARAVAAQLRKTASAGKAE